jgi:outer membrane lipoprotein LolB
MAIKVMHSPVQAFSADFDLQGSPHAGSLTFTSPLGTTLARLQWDPQAALLQANGQTQRFENLDALTQATVGASLPLESLFSWLVGIDAPAVGWEVDLQDIVNAGRLNARRLLPQTPVELKIVLDRR